MITLAVFVTIFLSRIRNQNFNRFRNRNSFFNYRLPVFTFFCPIQTVEVPSTAEECMLMDVDPNQMPGKGRGGSSSHNGNIYDEDDDERHGHGPQGVQCQTQ